MFSKDYRGIVDDASEQIQERVQSKRETARRNQIIDNQVNSEVKTLLQTILDFSALQILLKSKQKSKFVNKLSQRFKNVFLKLNGIYLLV